MKAAKPKMQSHTRTGWAMLRKLPSRSGVLAVWGAFPQDLLMPTCDLASVLPCEAGHACQRRVIEHDAGDAVGICMQNPEHCDTRSVSKSERAIYRLDEGKLVQRIAEVLGIRRDVQSVSQSPDVWSLGRIPMAGDRGLPVFFGFVGARDIDQVLSKLILGSRDHFLLIVSDSNCLKPSHHEAALVCRSRIIALDDVLNLAPDGTMSTVTAGPATVETWINEVGPSHSGVGSGIRFPTPPETTWRDITITFLSRDIISVKCGALPAANFERLHIAEMFAANSREKTPTDKWYLLMAFAARGPCLKMADLMKLFRSTNRLKVRKQKSELSKALQAFFGIQSEPLPFCKSRNVYEPELVIRQDTNTNLEDWLADAAN